MRRGIVRTMAAYTRLRAWNVAHQLAREVSKAAKTFPREERYELTSQLRRAALSVPTNIVEGRARYGTREFLRYVRRAISSLAEVEYLLLYARDEGYLDEAPYAQLLDRCKHASTLIARLARSLESSVSRPRQ